MELSREYLQRHKIHRVLEDCVEDLVLEQPTTKQAITKCICSRLETIRRRIDSPQQKVVFLIFDPTFEKTYVEGIAKNATLSCGASLLDGTGLTSEALRTSLVTHQETVFVLNYPTTIGEAIAFEGAFGKPFRTVLFQKESFVRTTPRTSPAFLAYAAGVNAVAEFYSARKQLIVAKDQNAMCEATLLANAFRPETQTHEE